MLLSVPCWGHGSQPHWFCRIPSRPHVSPIILRAGLWPEQLQDSDSALPFEVEGRSLSGAECQASHILPHQSLVLPQGLGQPDGPSCIPGASGGRVSPSSVMPVHGQGSVSQGLWAVYPPCLSPGVCPESPSTLRSPMPCSPASTLAHPLSTHDLLFVYFSPSAVLGTPLCVTRMVSETES